MPLYLYEYVLPDGTGGEQFEWMQTMAASPLTSHPESGAPCRRIFGTPNAPRAWTEQHAKSKTSDGNLERMGFTKYEKKGKGYMERTAGTEGPRSVSLDD